MASHTNMPHGKQVEGNLITSLRMAGYRVQATAALDHIHKLDCLIELPGGLVGLQISLNAEDTKIKVAAICGLDRAARFVFVHTVPDFFDEPSAVNGRDLGKLLNQACRHHAERALKISLRLDKIEIHPINLF